MVIVDARTSHKHGAYLQNKSDATTLASFDTFYTTAETLTGRKIHQLQTDWAFDSAAWREYCQTHGIIHEFTAPYLSAQNVLAEHVIQTTMDDVHTLLSDSGLNHSFWAEAAAYSIDTYNLIPSCCHPGRIPLEGFTGKWQDISYLWTFGAKCWAKIPTGLGGSKLDLHSRECCLLGYATGRGNYKVQDVMSHQVFVSWDVVFEEGQPHRTSASVGENIPIFNTNTNKNDPPTDTRPDTVDNTAQGNATYDNAHQDPVNQNPNHDQPNIVTIPMEQWQSTWLSKPLQASL